MPVSNGNVSFDGSSVQFRLDSPLLIFLDPLGLDMVREQLASLPVNARDDGGLLFSRVNVNFPVMGCYRVPNFQPGTYNLDPRHIKKVGDEDEDLDYEETQDDESESAEAALSFPFVSVDSGAILFADFAHLSQLVDLFSWEQYDLALQDHSVFGKIIDSLGGPYYAVVMGGCLPGMEFDGDGTYTLKEGAVKPCII